MNLFTAAQLADFCTRTNKRSQIFASENKAEKQLVGAQMRRTAFGFVPIVFAWRRRSSGSQWCVPPRLLGCCVAGMQVNL